VTAPHPGHVLRRAIIGWGLGHVALGNGSVGWSLLAAELVAALLVAWLTIGLADSSLYLIPFLAGIGFLVAWGWQAVAAYRAAQATQAARAPTPERSPATTIGWLSLPMLAWFTGFWLMGAHAATPAAALDRFVGAWTSGTLSADAWPPEVVAAADEAADRLGTGPDRFRDVRISIVSVADRRASAVADAIHYERRPSSFLLVFQGTELVPVVDERILSLELAATAVELPGGGDIGALRWELVGVSGG
jgi:hypothetical protein